MLPGIGDKSNRSAAKMISDARNFGPLFGALKVRESKFHLSSSDLVDGCLHQDGSWGDGLSGPSLAHFLG